MAVLLNTVAMLPRKIFTVCLENRMPKLQTKSRSILSKKRVQTTLTKGSEITALLMAWITTESYYHRRNIRTGKKKKSTHKTTAGQEVDVTSRDHRGIMSAGSIGEMVFIYSVFRQRAAMIAHSAWDWILPRGLSKGSGCSQSNFSVFHSPNV